MRESIILPGFALLLLVLASFVRAAVLPEDRLDVMYFDYQGGGMAISGPAVLVRKKIGQQVSVSAGHLVDNVSGASIDVEVSGASQIKEQRTEDNLGIDFLRDKTTLSAAYNTSTENDFDAKTYSINISQDMFGDLTTLAFGYSWGDDEITMSTDSNFAETAKRQNYRFAVTQILTKDLLVNFSHESGVDEGYLQNPYRFVRYRSLDDPEIAATQSEEYPNTRTSRANAIRAKYYLPYRAAARAEYRIYTDSWGIAAFNYEIGYTHPFEKQHLTLDVRYRFYHQDAADFYSDLFTRENETNFRGRDKELSSFDDTTVGLGLTYDYTLPAIHWLDKGQVSLLYDRIKFEYEDFRDARRTDLPAGEEPEYGFSVNVLRLIFTFFY